MLLFVHESRWSHAQPRDFRADPSHGGSACRGGREAQRGDQEFWVGSDQYLPMDSLGAQERGQRLGRAQTPGPQAYTDVSAEDQGSPLDLRQGSEAVWFRFWALDEEDRCLTDPGENGRHFWSDRRGSTFASDGDHTAETFAPSL